MFVVAGRELKDDESMFYRICNELRCLLEGFVYRFIKETQDKNCKASADKARKIVDRMMETARLKYGYLKISFPKKIRNRLFLKKTYRISVEPNIPINFLYKINRHFVFLKTKFNGISQEEKRIILHWLIKIGDGCYCSLFEIKFCKIDNTFKCILTLLNNNKLISKSIKITFEGEDLKELLKTIEKHIDWRE